MYIIIIQKQIKEQTKKNRKKIEFENYLYIVILAGFQNIYLALKANKNTRFRKQLVKNTL